MFESCNSVFVLYSTFFVKVCMTIHIVYTGYPKVSIHGIQYSFPTFHSFFSLIRSVLINLASSISNLEP